MSEKTTNPKDMLGAKKIPLSLFPQTAIATASLAFLNGALKHGRSNWRIAGVRSTIYLDAARRHLGLWEDGEEFDEDGVPNLGAAMACLAIIVDAEACGKLEDDRPPSIGLRRVFDRLTPVVEKLLERHAGSRPRHYTIADTEKN